MHAALMQNGRVIFLDKVENYSPLRLSNGQMAYSAEFDLNTRQAMPVSYLPNAFCSSGNFLADGRLVSLGGNDALPYFDPTVTSGFDGIRYIERSATNAALDATPWSEPGNKLASRRWYASSQTMPDGSVFVVSGSLTGLNITDNNNNNPTYEILDANAVTSGQNIPMDILVRNQPFYLYPFLHILRDGTIFVFTAKQSQIFDVAANRVVKELPDLPGYYRTYPAAGAAVQLPLSSANDYLSDILVCGGTQYWDALSPADRSCGRIQPEASSPAWEIDEMPEPRVMVEGTLLPDGRVLLLNGASQGAQGFGIADQPTLDALIYNPIEPLGRRFTVAGRSEIPRLYHSVALLLLDGSVLVAGSNPNEQPILATNTNSENLATKYPTEYRVEVYSPPYNSGPRPNNVVISTLELSPNGQAFEVTFDGPIGGETKVLLIHGGFVTHGLHMGQRMVVLESSPTSQGGRQVYMPEARYGHGVLPPGPYVLYVVVDGVPSVGQWARVL